MQSSEQVVCYIFDQTKENVLLVQKNRGPYPGKLNGVGGKGEAFDQSFDDIARREVFEETNLPAEAFSFFLEVDRVWGKNGMRLAVFAGSLKEGYNFSQKEDEYLQWVSLSTVESMSYAEFAYDARRHIFISETLLASKDLLH